MRAIIAAFAALALVVVPATSSPLFHARGQSPPTCNQGGGRFSCADADTACRGVTKNPVSLALDVTNKNIGSHGEAVVYVTRARSSATDGDLQDLCLLIVSTCCPVGPDMSKSTIPLPDDEQGSVQIVPAQS
jgi:hypothetical protein